MDKEKIKPNEEAGTSGDGEPARVDSPPSMPPVYAVVGKKSIKKKTPPDEEVSCLKLITIYHRLLPVLTNTSRAANVLFAPFPRFSEAAEGRRTSFVERVEFINLSKMLLLDF